MKKQLIGFLTVALMILGAACTGNADEQAAATTTATATSSSSNVSIAVVDGNLVFQKFQPAIEEELKKEFKDEQQKLMKMQEDLQKMSEQLDKESSIMSASEVEAMQQKFAEKQMEFQQLSVQYSETYNERGNEEFQKLIEKVQAAAKDLATKNGYTLVIQRGAVLYADDKYDITDALVKEIEATK